MAESAVAGNDDLDRLNVTLVEGRRDVLAAAVELLGTSRAVAAHRLAAAERTDPIHPGWLADCRRITDEWEPARWGADPTAAMMAFMERPRQGWRRQRSSARDSPDSRGPLATRGL